MESKPSIDSKRRTPTSRLTGATTPLDMREELRAFTHPSLVITTSLPRCTPQMRVGALNMSTR